MTDPAHHFGISADYAVRGNFTLDSASGAFVTPEPGTFGTTAALLLLIAAGAVFGRVSRSKRQRAL